MKSNDLQHPVLVVDDEADIRDLMEMTLMKMGLRVDTATGVEDAKNKLEGGDYSLVLTDMRMPDGSGLEVVQHINRLALDTPVAVITAFGNADQAVEALKEGAFDYLQKPITLSQLRSLVKSAVKVNEADTAHEPKPAAAQPAPAPADTSSFAQPDDCGGGDCPPLDFSGMPAFVPGRSQIQDYLDLLERTIIEQALQITRYNRTQAAKLLGISFRSMRYRMERLGIE